MKKNLLIGVLALLILEVCTPFICSMECSQVSLPNQDICMKIQAMNLTDIEKDLIISNLDYQDRFFPNHKYVFDRNTNLIISNAPNGVNIQQGKFVKDVWTSIFSVMPSILYNNYLYVPNQTKVFTGFNVKYNPPLDYTSSGYPNTNGGDCKRTYGLTKNISENKVYVNNIYQGSGKLVNVKITADSEIESFFIVNLAYSIDHYSWKKYCSRYNNGYCVKYSYKCQFNYNEVQQDNIQATDYLKVKYYNNPLFANLNTTSSYYGNTNFILNFSNSVDLTFQDSYYSFKEFIYSINYSKASYYVLTLKAEDYNQEQIKNLFKQNNNLIVKNTNNCSLTVFDFFNYINYSCYAEQKQVYLKIETDKLKYLLNETIKVYIYPQNISVNISYGNQSKIAKGNTTFISKPLENKITAINGNSKAERIIYVQEEDRFNFIFYIVLFVLINYLLYRILIKYWGKLV